MSKRKGGGASHIDADVLLLKASTANVAAVKMAHAALREGMSTNIGAAGHSPQTIVTQVFQPFTTRVQQTGENTWLLLANAFWFPGSSSSLRVTCGEFRTGSIRLENKAASFWAEHDEAWASATGQSE